ncbi:hypothetical protein [Bacillus thuringiensis]|uniref:hypothetical protein n=1 Tax=Bacillus thuringiensis TaxID=1428 RepID=UPI0032C4849B
MILYIHYNMLASDILVTLKEISVHFIPLIVSSKIPASKIRRKERERERELDAGKRSIGVG